VHPSEDDPGKFFVARHEGGVGISVAGEVGVVGHDERDSHDTCVEDGRENHESSIYSNNCVVHLIVCID